MKTCCMRTNLHGYPWVACDPLGGARSPESIVRLSKSKVHVADRNARSKRLLVFRKDGWRLRATYRHVVLLVEATGVPRASTNA